MYSAIILFRKIQGMKYEVQGKFVIIAICILQHDIIHPKNTSYCRLKGIFGSIDTLTYNKTSKISPNTLTTLLVNTKKHALTIAKLKTGKEIIIQGYIQCSSKQYHPIYVEEFLN